MEKLRIFYSENKKLVNLVGCFVVLAIVISIISLNTSKSNVELTIKSKPKGKNIDNYESIINSDESKFLSLQKTLQKNADQIKNIESQVKEYETNIKDNTEKELQKQQDENYQLRRKIESLEEKFTLKEILNQKSAQLNDYANINTAEENNNTIFRKEIRLAPRINNEEDELTIEDTIPAGSFAKSVLLHGMNAPASITAASEPIPLLLRIVDYANLPRKLRTDVEDCHVIAEGYAVLSSESVAIRLTKLICVEKSTKKIIETEVSGYVTGENGKEGLNGEVVHKDNLFVINSIMSGMFSGLGQTATPQLDIVPFGSGGMAVPPVMSKKIEMAATQGIANSMERLSKYYIDRAEQIQPVVSIDAGRVVDVVFTTTAKFGSKNVKYKIAQNREQNSFKNTVENNDNGMFKNPNIEKFKNMFKNPNFEE